MTTTETHLDPGAVRSVLSGERPRRPGPVATSGTFWWRAMLKIKHVPEQLFDVTAFPIIFLLMFTYLFGGALAGSTGAYLQQVLPGILVMTVTWITLYTGLNLNRDIQRGINDRFKSLPIWRPATIVGPLLADAVRYTLASLVILVLGFALGFRPGAGLTGIAQALVLLLVFSFAVSWIWTLLGLLVRSDNAVLGIGNMVMFPVTFVSNVFVAPETLPGWLEGFVRVNPVTTLVSAMRGLIHGGVDVRGDVLAVLVVSAGLIAVFGPLTMWAYRRRA